MLGEEDQRGEPPAERTPSREEVLSNLAAARNRFERQRGETQSPEMRQALDDGLDAIARFEDVLTIAVAVEKLGKKSVSYRFDFTNQHGDPVAVGRITAVFCMTSSPDHIASLEIPPEIRAKLEA